MAEAIRTSRPDLEADERAARISDARERQP